MTTLTRSEQLALNLGLQRDLAPSVLVVPIDAASRRSRGTSVQLRIPA